MDWREPASAVMSHGTAAVLRGLAGATEPFSVRELAKLTGISPTRARQAVTRLAEHGLVTTDSRSGALFVTLNRDHLATEPSVALANLRPRALDKLRAEITGWGNPPLHASLFGSAARGDGGTGSDLDVLVVHSPLASADQDPWDDQLARSGTAIASWTGNWVSWFQVSQDDLRRMLHASEPVLADWRRDAITLFGPTLPMLLRDLR